MKNPEILIEMYKIYGKPTVDWMGFKVTKNNHITYHHIKEDRNGGTETVERGKGTGGKRRWQVTLIFRSDGKIRPINPLLSAHPT